MALPLVGSVITWLGRALAGLGGLAGIGRVSSTAIKKAAPALAKTALAAGAIGALSKGGGSQSVTVQSPSAVATRNARLATLSERSYPLTDRQHKREIALAREELWLGVGRDLGVAVLHHPTMGFIAGIVAIGLVERAGILDTPTALNTKRVLLTAEGVRAASVLIDALVPG